MSTDEVKKIHENERREFPGFDAKIFKIDARKTKSIKQKPNFY
jgi:hypothetical protein